MAKRLDDDNLYVFDEDHVSKNPRPESTSLLERILVFVTSRYFVLGAIFSVFGLLILITTISLDSILCLRQEGISLTVTVE